MFAFTPKPRLLAALLGAVCALTLRADDKNVLLVAGPPSHGPGAHEFNAGVQLLAKGLAGVPGLHTEIALNGWPHDAAALARADAVVIYADGGPNHIALAGDHLAQLDAFAKRGGGIGFMHYAVEPTIEKGETEFLRWVGGCFEINRSVNPIWEAHFTSLPNHPVARGVQPFTIRDEWYFNLRFAGNPQRLTRLLVAVPPASSMVRRDGPHEGNPEARALVARGEPQTLAWVFEREDGGRGFGFTGGHFHANWANENVRRLVLNAIVWLAKMDVPAGGVVSTVTPSELEANLDPKGMPAARSPARK